MRQIQFRLGLRPDPARGAYSAPPDTLAGFEGPTRGERMRGEGREEKGREGREEKGGERRPFFLVMWPRRLSALNPPLIGLSRTVSEIKKTTIAEFSHTRVFNVPGEGVPFGTGLGTWRGGLCKQLLLIPYATLQDLCHTTLAFVGWS